MDAALVDHHVLHLEVGLLAGLLVLKLHEGVAQRVARLLVALDLALSDRSEAREDDLEVLVLRDRVELADEKAAEVSGTGAGEVVLRLTSS